MKKLILLPILFVILISIPSVWLYSASLPVCQKDCNDKIFVVEKGEGVSMIGQKLTKEGLIRSPLAFRLLVMRYGLTSKIQAGDFRLSPKSSLKDIAFSLTHGTLDRWVKLLEGWRREEMADEIAKELGDKNFSRDTFINKTKDLEGKLFPDTYLIQKEATAEAVINKLTTNYEKKTNQLQVSKENLILASIVEREAKFAADRPLVAGILLNRLGIKMALQVDASIQYAIGTLRCRGKSNCDWWPRSLTRDDLEINSPFNTYHAQGLPPTPICNPGLASIKAVLNPTESDYLYYLSDASGKMYYAKTLDEHNENIRLYLNK